MKYSFLISGIFLSVCLCVMLFVAIKRKAFTVGRCLVMLLVAAAAVPFFIFMRQPEAAEPDVKEPEKIYSQADNDLYFARSLAADGNTEEALNLLGRSVGADDERDSLLLCARLCALEGQYEKSYLYYVLYGRAGGEENVTDEMTFVDASAHNVTENAAVAEYYRNNPEASDPYKTVKNVVSAVYTTRELFEESLRKKMQADLPDGASENSGLSNAAKAISASYDLERYENASDEEKAALKELSDRVNKLVRTNEKYKDNAALRLAALKINCWLGNGTEIVKNISESSISEELMVASELMTRGYVNAKTLTTLGKRYDDEQITAIVDRCESVIDNDTELTGHAKKEYSEIVKSIKNIQKSYVQVSLLEHLTNSAKSKDCSDPSKAFLTAAKGYSYLNVTDRFSGCVDSALNTYTESEDSEYVESMRQITYILNGDEGTDVRELGQHVSDALDRTMPVDLSAVESTGPKDGGSGEEGAKTFDEQFKDSVTENLEKKRSIINIGRIDKSEYPKSVTFEVSFGDESGITSENFRSNVTILDCGQKISEYTLTKVSDMSGKIILLCDLSGSMSGKEEDLRKAIYGFADRIGANEEIAVATFSSGIRSRSGFLTDPAEIKKQADNFYASGGTNMLTSIERLASEMFTQEINNDNIMIVMTDGVDYDKVNDNSVRDRIRSLVAKNDCTIYTIGLGFSVDTDYLSLIAANGNGKFIYVDSADELDSFYGFIHTQLRNRYTVTFTPKNKADNRRMLEVELNDVTGSAVKEYVIDESVVDYDDYTDGAEVYDDDEMILYGLSSRVICKTSSETELSLYGEKFSSGESYQIKLSGSNTRAHELQYSFVSENELKIIIPAGVATDTYSLTVISSKEKAELSDALTVSKPVKRKTFSYGSYVFECSKLEKKDDGVLMSGDVVLNNWLTFLGDVKLYGQTDPKLSQYVELQTDGRTEILYKDPSVGGLTGWMASYGIAVEVSIPNSIRIYGEAYDPGDYESFTVHRFMTNIPLTITAVIGGELSLYPDMFRFSSFYHTPEYKYLDDLIKNFPKSIFYVNCEGDAMLTSNEICVHAKLSLDYEKDNDTEKKFSLTKLALTLKKFEAELNTSTHEASLSFEVGFAAFKMKGGEFKGVGLELGWKDGKIDKIQLGADYKVQVCVSPIPLYLSDFVLGVSDITDVKSLKDVLQLTVTGGFNLSTVDFLQYLDSDFAKKIFDTDELPFAEFDEARINVSLGKLNINFSTKLKILGVQVAEAKVNIGKFSYTHALLGIDTTEYGIDAEIKAGISINWDNFDFDYHNTVGLTLGYPFSGFRCNGNIDLALRVFFIEIPYSERIDFAFGLYFNRYNELQFMIVGEYMKNNRKCGFRIDWSRSSGLDFGTY